MHIIQLASIHDKMQNVCKTGGLWILTTKVMRTVSHMVMTSTVLKKVSKKPNGSMLTMLPLPAPRYVVIS
jgi:hypothetical protein